MGAQVRGLTAGEAATDLMLEAEVIVEAVIAEV